MTDCDVAIIGGGPAGAAAATVLAREGLAATVIERERFPRFHVGESLLPLGGEVLDRLGVTAKVAAAGFVPKYGAWFLSNDGACESPVDFEQFLPPPHNRAFQVERADFDQLLLDHAAEAGAEVLTGWSAAEVTCAAGDCRLALTGDGGEGARGRRQLSARWVVDASGQSSLLARRLGLRTSDPALRKVAHFAHYQGGRRRPGKREGDISLVFGRGCWFWHIPLRRGRASVGCVIDHERWKAAEVSAEEFLAAAVATSPWLAAWLAGAERVTPTYTLADFSYSARRLAGDGWLLAGDAAAFLDPIFSTGVFLALRSGEAAGLLLARALRSGRPPSAAALAAYERRFRGWTRSYFRMIRAFYRPQFPGVLFNPVPLFFGPIARFLAGRLDLPWRERLILELFLGVVRLNRYLPIAPDPRSPEAAVYHG
jgi:flavin-dependent dehydrogenase